MFQLTTAAFAETISELEQALAWLEEMKLSTQKTRYGTYLRTLKMIDKRWREGATRANEIPVDPVLMETAVLEAWQLHRIARAFGRVQPDGLLPKLKMLIGGPVIERDEKAANSGNRARDYGFELDVAAYFSQAGPIDLTAGVDVMTRIQTMPHFVECKRPSSQAMIPANLDEASEQIMKLLTKTYLACYGIAAISITKAHWKGWPLVRGQSMETIRVSLTAHVDQFDRDYFQEWFRRQADGRLAAILVCFPYVAYTGDSPTIVGTELFLIGNRFLPGTLAGSDLERLVHSLGPIH